MAPATEGSCNSSLKFTSPRLMSSEILISLRSCILRSSPKSQQSDNEGKLILIQIHLPILINIARDSNATPLKNFVDFLVK